MYYHQVRGSLHYAKCINYYVTDCIGTPYISYFIKELCICSDFGHFYILISTALSQLIEDVCTI